jgi:mannonate dehydratase
MYFGDTVDISLRLSNLSNEEFKFLRQIGVNRVDVHNPMLIHGYERLGEDYFRNVPKVIDRIRNSGLRIGSFRFSKVRNALFGRSEGSREVDALCRLIKVLGENEVRVIQFDTHAARLSPGGVPGRFEKEQRAGYRMDAFKLDRMRNEIKKKDPNSRWAHHFKDKLSAEEYFENLVSIYKLIIPILEDSGVRLAIHTDDPPVPNNEGLLPGITTPQEIQRLLDALPSPNSGILFCTGTRYESGIDIKEQINMFGPKIFHIHFRNVRGTLPKDGEYDEVMLDDGDMNMLEVLRALDKVGYDGSLNPDHDPVLVSDSIHRNAARAFATGYIRALISAL